MSRVNTGYKFKAFSSDNDDLATVLSQSLKAMERDVEQETEDYILNVNQTDFINHLVAKYAATAPVLDYDHIHADSYETTIVEKLPREIAQYTGRSERRTPAAAYTFFIPGSGELEMLKYRPSPNLVWTPELIIVDSYTLGFEIIARDGDAEAVNREQEHIIYNLKQQVGYIAGQIEGSNQLLRRHAEDVFSRRKNRILSRREMDAAIKVPLKTRDEISGTFAVPTPAVRMSVTASKPVVRERGFKPEPTLPDQVYRAIVQTIFDVGKMMERLKDTYKDKGEEALRDHFLMFLEPQFGNATGETFNKNGDTDILLRHDNSHVFVGECKFWTGPKGYLDTIDQLLGYLTWRDSKAAIVMFVDNENLTSVLESIKGATPKHPNYLGFVNEEQETWFNYRIHVNGDPNREVKLAVLVIHLPKGK